MKKIICISLFIAASLFSATAALAHQPRLVDGPTAVDLPEVSKAYYGELSGQPAEFRIDAPGNFKLYLGLLVPDLPGARTDMSLTLYKDGGVVAFLDGRTSSWNKFHEEFANDDYLSGPEYRMDAGPGSYVISIRDNDNLGKYVLAVGEKEEFTFADTVNALRTIPRLKRDFFGKSPADFALSIMGGVELAVSVVLGLLIGLIYQVVSRRLLRARPVHSLRKNIGRPDRLIRVALALVLLAGGIALWSIGLLVAAGFVLYEAGAGWCALYQAMGRNTCPAALATRVDLVS